MEHLVISVAAPKGGVGKTTTVANLAVGLAQKNKRILLIDADPSGYCSLAFGYDENKIFGNLGDLYTNSKDIYEIIHKTELPFLELIPFRKLEYKDEIVFNNLTLNRHLLKIAIEKVKINYDYVLIDCPPILYGTTINSLIASDYILIPVKSSKFSLDAISKMIQFVKEIQRTENPNIILDGLILTMYEKKTRASFQTKKELYRLYPNLIFNTTIPKNTIVTESTFYKKPVLLYDPKAIASLAYNKLVDELIDKHETTSLMSLSGFKSSFFEDYL